MRQRVVVRALIAATAATVTACGAGQPSTTGTEPDAKPSPSTASPAPGATPAKTAPPAAFAAAVASPGTFVLNVHTPDAGSIPGTDAEVPFDQLRARASELPGDRTTPIAVYCRSGRMSAEAIPVLQSLGYTDITELAGGMDAWTAAGRPLLAD